MPLEREDIRKALTSKGFHEEDNTNKKRDHDFYFLYVGQKRQAIYTKLSRGTSYRTYGDDLVAKMARQLMITKPVFTKLVTCTIDGAEYITMLRKSGVTLTK